MGPGKLTEVAGKSAGEVYEEINFLTIKKSVRKLLELQPGVLEDFVKKYSIVVIYILNIVDGEVARNVLEKLSNQSILSLVEEELRMILIRTVARKGENIEELLLLSGYLDMLDRPSEPPKSADDDTTKEALRVLFLDKQNVPGREYFLPGDFTCSQTYAVRILLTSHDLLDAHLNFRMWQY